VLRTFAIVLRGPTGVGKTTVGQTLLGLLNQPSDSLVNLDNGWSDEEFRCTLVPERYPDLRQRRERVLVIELANGEPVRNVNQFMRSTGPVEPGFWYGSPGPGATANPTEWVDLLRLEGREPHSFLLSIDWQTACVRRGESVQLRRWHDLYSQPIWVNFASRAGIPEERISVYAATPQEIATTILRKLGLSE
jgi:hypothetical protein